jgi:hypothetical protein
MVRLPIELDIAVPVPSFKVGMIALGKGHVVESRWGHGDDLPLAAGKVQLAWCEFEVIESRLAVCMKASPASSPKPESLITGMT